MSTRPTDCDQCGLEFYNDWGLELRVQEILHESGPADAREFVDECYQEWHDNGHRDEAP